ncbi:MAG: 5'-methylthioadenosine/S-adenosylhomocysteine nucleosidase [Chloroflexota bacterium]|nr:5'-methylthioadenosine/S-adenosylhomocysteine nucleosidase [Chloroflexota bacterium]
MQRFTHIGIVVPTRMEQGPLVSLLEEITGQASERVVHGIWHIQRTYLNGVRISITHSSIGMVNAGAATEALIIYEQPEALINYGIAGSHTHEGLPGDVIVATEVCAPFSGYLQTGGVLDSAFGIRWDDDVTGAHTLVDGKRFWSLPCDPDLVACALQAAQVLSEQHALTIVPPPGQEMRPVRILSGVVASADTYCRDESTFASIRARFGSLCEDMESAAVGQVASRHGLPFAIVRCLSNNDLLEVLSGERKGLLYLEMAHRAALVTAQLLRMLAEEPRPA